MNDYEYETQGEGEEMEKRTLHTLSVLEWMNEMREEREESFSMKAESFLNQLEMKIVKGEWYISRHPLGDSEILLEKIDPWVQGWLTANDPETDQYDPELERLLEDFQMQDEFSRFEHVVTLDMCQHCGNEHQDVKTVYDSAIDLAIQICNYGCDDPRSQPQPDENEEGWF